MPLRQTLVLLRPVLAEVSALRGEAGERLTICGMKVPEAAGSRLARAPYAWPPANAKFRPDPPGMGLSVRAKYRGTRTLRSR